MPRDEQVDVKTAAMEGDSGSSQSMSTIDQAAMQSSFVGLVSGGVSAIPEAEKAQMEMEKMKLYQQLDDKVMSIKKKKEEF